MRKPELFNPKWCKDVNYLQKKPSLKIVSRRVQKRINASNCLHSTMYDVTKIGTAKKHIRINIRDDIYKAAGKVVIYPLLQSGRVLQAVGSLARATDRNK